MQGKEYRFSCMIVLVPFFESFVHDSQGMLHDELYLETLSGVVIVDREGVGHSDGK